LKNIELEHKISEILDSYEYDVVEIRTEERKRFSIIKIFIDKDGGISIDDCSKVSRIVNDMIEEDNLLNRDFRLEVSSPGLHRPLHTVRDFQRQLNKNIQVIYQEDNKTQTVEGKLVTVSEDSLILQQQKRSFALSFDKIIKGKVVLPW